MQLRTFALAIAAVGTMLMTMPAETAFAQVKDTVTVSDFGKSDDGTKVELYTLTNKNGLVAKIMTYGAIVTELHVPDKSGKMGDVTLGFDSLAPYIKGHPFFGAIAGRVAPKNG